MGYRLGLVLSGGGVRGVAHIGVLAALAERGLAVDCVAGTSSGAIVGAFYAAGCPTAAMLDFFAHRSPFKLSMVSMGKPGIIDTAKVRADLLEYLPEDSFEALGKRLFLAATDLVNGKLVIFESGPLICAILASSSMPGVFTPTEIDGRWYADGGVLNNFPVEPLKGLCDVIVGVYASPLKAVHQDDLTSSLAVLQRALEVGIYNHSKTKFHVCDVMLCPQELYEHSTFSNKHVREIYEIGYRAALERLDAIEEALAAII